MNKVAFIVPDENPITSTFIMALWRGLPEPKDFLYGLGIPAYSINNGYILKPTFWDKIKQRIFKYDLKTYLFEKYLIKQNIKVVIAEYGVTAAIIIDSCKKLNIKLITHFHGYDAYEKKVIDEYQEKYKEVFNYSKSIISVSKDMTKQLINLGAIENKILYNPCAPNDIFYTVEPNYKSNTFISIGRFVDKKAPYYTILAFKQVHDKYPESRIKMIGDGVLLNSCINLTIFLGLENVVEFTGNINQSEIIKHLSDSFCFVQHSIIALNGDSEGTPVSVFEASAAGLPIVATKHAGIPDIVLENETAFLVNEHDVDSMAQKMIFLYNDRQIAQKMGQSGKDYIKNNFSMKQYIDNVINQI